MNFLIILEVIGFINRKKFSYLNLSAIILFIVTNPLVKSEPKAISPVLENLNVRLVKANISNFLKVEFEQGGYASTKEVLDKY